MSADCLRERRLARTVLIRSSSGDASYCCAGRANYPIAGCINIVIDAVAACHTSMLAVAPSEQTAGIDKAVKHEIERQANLAGAPEMRMGVIRQRKALIASHRRRGYKPMGETLPFSYDDPSVGRPLRPDLELVGMEKRLNSSDK